MYSVIIGLEVHVQLQTQTKIFCGCSTAFNPDQPNVQTCPVCLGLPGSLPVLNERALHLAIKTALALNCQIARFTKWDRKQYFYPDLPKGYQISQYDLPFSHDGWVEVAQEEHPARRIGIIRAHLEEDAGKNLHDESGRGRDSQVDLNRAGTPLVEIVTQPDLRSAQEARLFLEELRRTLTYLEVSDCNMQEGSLRCDANVNLHVQQPDGSTVATPIVEIKNLNSFRFTEQAIEFEVKRQWDEFRKTGRTIKDAPKSTRGYDAERGVTYPLREKEEAADYRYFPDPDLVPVVVDEAWLARIRKEIVDLPTAKRQRFQSDHGLSEYDAGVIIDQGKSTSKYYEAVVDDLIATQEVNVTIVNKKEELAKQAANWVTQDVLRELKERQQEISEFAIGPDVLAYLISKINAKLITIKSAREVFLDLLNVERDGPATVAEIDQLIASKGLHVVDTIEITQHIDIVIEKNPKAVADFRSGKQAAIGALIGQVMKAVKGADPQTVREMLVEEVVLVMTAADRERWDAKYTDRTLPEGIVPPEWLARQAVKLKPGRALDLACGEGHAAIWLAKHGWNVTGIDISKVGLEIASKLAVENGAVVRWIVGDLDDYVLGTEKYDLITVFRFLDRRLPEHIAAALRPGGWLIYETFLAVTTDSPGHVRNAAFLLQPGELPRLLPELQTLIYEEAKVGADCMARLVARKS